MLIFLLLVAVFVVGIVLAVKSEGLSRKKDIGEAVAFISGLCLFCYVMVWGITFGESLTFVEEFNSVEDTVEKSREQGRGVETAALQVHISKVNAGLSSYKYWNEGMFDVFITDKVEKLEPIE